MFLRFGQLSEKPEFGFQVPRRHAVLEVVQKDTLLDFPDVRKLKNPLEGKVLGWFRSFHQNEWLLVILLGRLLLLLGHFWGRTVSGGFLLDLEHQVLLFEHF